MAAYFGATEGTPISAILLVTEMVGSVDQILPMTILTFIAYFTSMTLGAKNSIYEALRMEMLAKLECEPAEDLRKANNFSRLDAESIWEGGC